MRSKRITWPVAYPLVIFILLLQLSLVQSLLCYRCDSVVEADCPFYPAPMSTYENCSERPQKLRKAYQQSTDFYGKTKIAPSIEDTDTQTLFVRYRYKLCPIMERTIQQVVPLAPSPMENVNYVCGKASTHGVNGIRIRRGCTPDLFLNGADACVSVSPWGKTDIACFCNTDFCNEGSSLQKGTTLFLAMLSLHSLPAILS